MPSTDNAERLSITLPPEMVKAIKARVSSGSYSSNSEVIREAIRVWQKAEEERNAVLDSVRQRTLDSRQQIEQGHSTPADLAFDEVLTTLKKRVQ